MVNTVSKINSSERLYKTTNLGTAIKEVRTRRNMTQKALGLALGFKESSADIRVAQYESGKRIPKSELLRKIEKVLSCEFNAVSYVEYSFLEPYKDNVALLDALARIKSHKIAKHSFACASVDDVSYDKKQIVVDVAYDCSEDGAVNDAEPIYEAPASKENINIANTILSKIKETYGIEVIPCKV